RDLLRFPESATLSRTGPDVEALAFGPEGKTLVSVTVGGTLQVWDVATGLPRSARSLPMTRELVSPAVLATFNPDGTRLGGRSRDDERLVQVWDVEGGEVAALRGHTMPVFCIHFSQDGRHVATCGWKRKGAAIAHEVKVWDVKTAKPVATLPGGGAIFNLAF